MKRAFICSFMPVYPGAGLSFSAPEGARSKDMRMSFIESFGRCLSFSANLQLLAWKAPVLFRLSPLMAQSTAHQAPAWISHQCH